MNLFSYQDGYMQKRAVSPVSTQLGGTAPKSRTLPSYSRYTELMGGKTPVKNTGLNNKRQVVPPRNKPGVMLPGLEGLGEPAAMAPINKRRTGFGSFGGPAAKAPTNKGRTGFGNFGE